MKVLFIPAMSLGLDNESRIIGKSRRSLEETLGGVGLFVFELHVRHDPIGELFVRTDYANGEGAFNTLATVLQEVYGTGPKVKIYGDALLAGPSPDDRPVSVTPQLELVVDAVRRTFNCISRTLAEMFPPPRKS
jgi:hypothetical protein